MSLSSVPPSAKRASRFDPFLATLLSAPSGAAPSPAAELARLKNAHDWFDTARARGTLEWSRAHPLSKGEAPLWLGYEHAAEDWDAMTQSLWHDAHGPIVAHLDPKPARVLDVGCGAHAGWIVSTAQAPGWEHTQFVGLDLAPSLVPMALLPEEVRKRVAFVQHNVLDSNGLPFFDEEFDFVRISCLNSAIPEFAWDPLVEECRRVLKKGCKLEVLDTLFSLYMPRALPSIIDACERIVTARFISLNLHASIPPALAMNDLKSMRTVQLPVLPAPARVPSSSEGGKMPAGEEQARLLLHLWSQRVGSHALPLARAVEDTYLAGAAPGERTAKDSAAKEREHEGAILEWTAELREVAGVAALLEGKWGWRCAFDEKLEGELARRVPGMERELGECARARAQARRDNPARVQELDAVQHQLEVQKREAEHELNLVQRRLRRAPVPRPSERESMGIFGGEAWVSRKGAERS
ncbi:hypothetical protein JCM10450v2_005943 [Rhodotorula kratochvilovae]